MRLSEQVCRASLRESFRYDALSGELFWIEGNRKTRHPGDKLGGLDKSTGYVSANLAGKHHYVHVLIWIWHFGKPKTRLDHINGNKQDNRIENLREATPSTNAANSKKRIHNTSGWKGVSWCHGKWQAKIRCGGTQYYLGRFSNKEDAARAYDGAAVEHFGKFARGNFIGASA